MALAEPPRTAPKSIWSNPIVMALLAAGAALLFGCFIVFMMQLYIDAVVPTQLPHRAR